MNFTLQFLIRYFYKNPPKIYFSLEFLNVFKHFCEAWFKMSWTIAEKDKIIVIMKYLTTYCWIYWKFVHAADKPFTSNPVFKRVVWKSHQFPATKLNTTLNVVLAKKISEVTELHASLNQSHYNTSQLKNENSMYAFDTSFNFKPLTWWHNLKERTCCKNTNFST